VTDTGDENDSGLGGILGRAGSAALRPVRGLAHAGRDALTDEAQRAIDGVMAGPLPEAVGRSLVENDVIQRVVTSAMETQRERGAAGEAPPVDFSQLEQALHRTLENPAVARMLTETVNSKLTVELADSITRSPGFQRALKNALSSPEVRHALERQTAGFGSDIATAARRKARGADGSPETFFHRLLGRPRQDPARERYGGLVTRGLGFVTDLLCTQLVYLVLGGMIGLVTSIFGTLRPTWLVGTLAGIGGFLVVGLYFVVFWTTAGQTPGMRVMRLRVEHNGEPPAVWRSVVRLVGLVLAVVPLFAGYLPVLFDPKRRALPDYLAGTTVVRQAEPGDPT
jgi:uncharacterized RDD family membrane protein YckC